MMNTLTTNQNANAEIYQLIDWTIAETNSSKTNIFDLIDWTMTDARPTEFRKPQYPVIVDNNESRSTLSGTPQYPVIVANSAAANPVLARLVKTQTTRAH